MSASVRVLEVNAEKKRLGAYYTPKALSDIMACWAIRSSENTVLEPSFGGCSFLKSCANRLVETGCLPKKLPLFGCDIDPSAFTYLSSTVGSFVDLANFALDDFLAFERPSEWPESFDVIIGNPPYVAYQNISHKAKELALKEISEIGLDLDLRASLWAYFVTLSLKYLKRGGRIAWVLPGSFLYANYAQGLRWFLGGQFSDLVAFSIKERLFIDEGADEQTVVLLAEGYNPKIDIPTLDIPLKECSTIADLEAAINSWGVSGSQEYASCDSPVFSFLSASSQASYLEISRSSSCAKLRDFLDVRIGLVTGANTFFVLNQEQANAHNLSIRSLYPVLSRFSSASGLSFSKHDHNWDQKNGKRCLLVSVSEVEQAPSDLRNYLQSFPEETIQATATFRKRKLWCETNDKKVPHAFFPVMSHSGPRLALNVGRVNCTNSIHRVYFKSNVDKTKQKHIAISLLSTFSQISAEIEGRKYGAGVLKHEPREAEKIKVLLPDAPKSAIVNAFSCIDRLLRDGKASEARELADKFIMDALGMKNRQTLRTSMQEALLEIRSRRYPDRKKSKG